MPLHLLSAKPQVADHFPGILFIYSSNSRTYYGRLRCRRTALGSDGPYLMGTGDRTAVGSSSETVCSGRLRTQVLR